MITAEELKTKWIIWVKKLLGLETYRVSRSYNRSIEKGARLISQYPAIDPDRFCRVQILLALNKRQKILPTLLAGRSIERYREYPSERQEMVRAKESLLFEIRDFSNMVKFRGFDAAVNQRLSEHTPLFLGLMYLDYRGEIPEEIMDRARAQLEVDPVYRLVLPTAYVKQLEGTDDA